MFAKVSMFILILSSTAYGAGDCADYLKKSSQISNYSKPAIGFNSNLTETLQVNILKAKIIVEASQEASEKHAAEYLLSNGVNLENDIELSLFTGFVLGARNRHLVMYDGGTPSISVKQKVNNSNKTKVSKTSQATADLLGVSTNKNFAKEKLYKPAFLSKSFPASLKIAEKLGLIKMTDKQTFASLESTLTPLQIEEQIQHMAMMIHSGQAQVAYGALKEIFELSKDDENLSKIDPLVSQIENLNPLFASSQYYLLSVLSGKVQFSKDGYQQASLTDFQNFTEIIFDSSTNENTWKKRVHDTVVARLQATKKPTTKELTEEEYLTLKKQYDYIYRAPLRIFESYTRLDSPGFATPAN